MPFRIFQIQGHATLVAVNVLKIRPVASAAHAAFSIHMFR